MIEVSTSMLMALRDIVAERIRDQHQVQTFIDITAGGVETSTEQLLTFLLNPRELLFCPRMVNGGRGACVVHDGQSGSTLVDGAVACAGCGINVADELRKVAARYIDTKLTLEKLVVNRAGNNGDGRPAAAAAAIERSIVRIHALLEDAGATAEELLDALEKSVQLQSHYAQLLNAWDGGERLQFENGQAWLARLRSIKPQPATAV